ncbi:MAG: MTAP family purine nucleoside phosphorylase [Acidimicrobiales bacterium]|nr:MTAP family purine nucleoside phosphorylase [Acidimicrobiales bacterium]
MGAPKPHGSRLAVVTGSGLGTKILAGGHPRTVATSRGPLTIEEHTGCNQREQDGVIVIRRHGIADFTPAHRLNHHRTIEGIAAAGCDRVLALNSVGSLRADWPVGTLVAVDDFVAPWVTLSFYDDERGHSVPGIDAGWRAQVVATWRDVSDIAIIDGGTYVQTTGPRFETPAEIRWFATFADVIGMTMASECILAREAGLSYASICIVDNFANGIAGQALSVEAYTSAINDNAARLAPDLEALVSRLATTH